MLGANPLAFMFASARSLRSSTTSEPRTRSPTVARSRSTGRRHDGAYRARRGFLTSVPVA